MMYKKILFLGLICTMLDCAQTGGAGGGAGGGASTTADPTTDSLLVGHWLSDCVDLGSGDVNRIYLEIDATLKVNIAYLTYTGVNCLGTYVLTDGTGSTVAQAQYAQNIVIQTVTDIPDNFLVIQVTDILSLAVQYAVLYINDAEFYELAGLMTPHETWTQWQGEADVFAFSQNPTTYNPLTYVKYHFTKSELP